VLTCSTPFSPLPLFPSNVSSPLLAFLTNPSSAPVHTIFYPSSSALRRFLYVGLGNEFQRYLHYFGRCWSRYTCTCRSLCVSHPRICHPRKGSI
jgi:hypothetical protein